MTFDSAGSKTGSTWPRNWSKIRTLSWQNKVHEHSLEQNVIRKLCVEPKKSSHFVPLAPTTSRKLRSVPRFQGVLKLHTLFRYRHAHKSQPGSHRNVDRLIHRVTGLLTTFWTLLFREYLRIRSYNRVEKEMGKRNWKSIFGRKSQVKADIGSQVVRPSPSSSPFNSVLHDSQDNEK